jgi:hypothetical protein
MPPAPMTLTKIASCISVGVPEKLFEVFRLAACHFLAITYDNIAMIKPGIRMLTVAIHDAIVNSLDRLYSM